MHYKTLVIGPSVEAQLEPFDEAIVVAPYVDEHGETTTASPDARFDWWVIGGGWSPALVRTDGTEGDTARKGDVDFVALEARDGRPFSVHAVVAEGVWREPERTGTTDFGVTVATEEDLAAWRVWVEMFLHGLPDQAVLTVVDCHQ